MLRGAVKKLMTILLPFGGAIPNGKASHWASSVESTNSPHAGSKRRRDRHSEPSNTIVRNSAAQTVLAGCVQLLGLGDIKKDLGARWHELAGAAYRITDGTIRTYLNHDDSYERHDEETYILCFAHADKSQAEATTRQIAHEIKTRIAKEVPDISLRVNHTVAELEWTHVEQGDISIVDGIAQELRAIRENAEVAAANWRRHILQNATTRYSPIWSPKRNLVSIHRVLLDEDTGKLALEKMAGVIAVEELTGTLFELDCLIVGRSVRALHALLQGGGKGQLLIPVNINSLATKQNRDTYVNLCRDIPQPYRRYILFELHGAAVGTPISRIVEIAGAVKPYAHDIIVEIRHNSPQLNDLAAMGVSRVSVDFSMLSQDLAEAGSRLARLASVATALNIKILLHGADTIGMAELATRAGVDLVDGRAVALTTDELKSVYRWKPQ